MLPSWLGLPRPFSPAWWHSQCPGSGRPGSPARCWLEHPGLRVPQGRGEQAPPADPRARAGSGLSGATEGMPALHQLLGLAEHLVPVLQLLAPGIHVGAHHHPAQRVALCGGGKTSSLSGPQKPHHFSNIPRAFSLSLSYSSFRRVEQAPSLSKQELTAPKGPCLCSGVGDGKGSPGGEPALCYGVTYSASHPPHETS